MINQSIVRNLARLLFIYSSKTQQLKPLAELLSNIHYFNINLLQKCTELSTVKPIYSI